MNSTIHRAPSANRPNLRSADDHLNDEPDTTPYREVEEDCLDEPLQPERMASQQRHVQ